MGAIILTSISRVCNVSSSRDNTIDRKKEILISIATGKSKFQKDIINWNILKAPKENGGLDIKDPMFMKLIVGENKLWKIVLGGQEWWNSIMYNKYARSNRLICLDSSILEGRGSHVWTLCKSIEVTIQRHISYVPSNGKEIRIWEDNIIGQLPLRRMVVEERHFEHDLKFHFSFVSFLGISPFNKYI